MKDETFGFNGKLCKAGFILSFFLKSFAPVHYALLYSYDRKLWNSYYMDPMSQKVRLL